jgi:hypothetical protein
MLVLVLAYSLNNTYAILVTSMGFAINIFTVRTAHLLTASWLNGGTEVSK